MAEMKQRSLEEVKSLSVEETVEIMRQAGIVGAGGGGFPTYFKYKRPQPRLIVNATESEPGYWGDKLIHRHNLDKFMELFEAMKAIFEFEEIILGVHYHDEEWYSNYDEVSGNGLFEVRHVPDTYGLGEEKTLVKHSTETKVPLFVDNPDGSRRPGMPPDVGIIVNNSETLLNVYKALFLGKPTTTKFFSVYGLEEGIVDLKVYEAPVGASVREILEIAGLDVERKIPGLMVQDPENADYLTVIDGGPYLHDVLDNEAIRSGAAYVRRMTNSLILMPEGRQGKEYAPEIKTYPPEEGIVSLVGKVSGVQVPLGGGLLTPSTPLVSEGDEVEYEQQVGEPVDTGFSVGAWASAAGTVSSIENGLVAIVGDVVPEEDSEVKAETEGGSELRGEAEPFKEAVGTGGRT